MAFPEIGTLAPEFALPDQNGETVTLRQFRGVHQVILYFYPKAMTPGCTVQACGMRDVAAELSALDAVVLGVSPDPVSRLARFAERDRLTFELLSDPEHEVAVRYGAWGPKRFMGRSYEGILRTTFIIGRDGRLRHVLGKVRTRTHHEDVLALLRPSGAER